MQNKIPLSQVINFVSRGISPKYSDNGYKVINQRCIRENMVNFENARFTDKIKTNIKNEKYLRKWDVVVNSTRVGTLGRVAQIKKEYEFLTADSHVTILRPDLEKINGGYFGYAICEKEKIIEKLGKGATGQTELSRNDLLDLKINLFDKTTQKKIGSILSVYDELIKNNNRRIEILEEIAEIIYKEWFVHFRFPSHEKVKMIDSELGKIPEGWEIKKLSKIVDTQYGYTESASDKIVGPKFLRGKDINKNSYINWSSVPYCKIESNL